MPNTGRLYAPPTAAAAYRERYMRPYSTVSPPIGVAGLAANVTAPPKGAVPPASYSRSSLSMRRSPDNEVSAPYTTAYESRVRSRPIASYEDDRQWNNNYTEKQRGRTQQAWLDEEDEISVHHRASLSSISQLRSTEMTRQHRISSAPTYNSTPNMTNRASLESPHPSTLPRLSSLLKRGPTDARHYESDEHFPTRKRAHEASPRRDSFEHEPKINRHFYEDDVFADRRAPSKYNDGMWGGEEHVQESRVIRHEVTMAMKNPRSYGNSAQLDGRSQSSPLTSSRQYMEPARYPYMNNEANTASPREPIRRSSTRPDEQFKPRQGYEDRSKGYDMPRRSYYMPDEQRNEPSPVGLKSPTPSAVVRDRFSPVGRYSENKDADSVIEAAADLVEERSPSKRESITKLLLKSKEFLKAKSLVRNRNNEIDWVATFLNVGFESNSIYSLMCPLRKGRWKVEEEKYTMELLRLIESGVIRLRHGQSIRGFIAKKLHSDDMRVLKKLSNCKMFHFARLINPRMSDVEEIDNSIPNVRASLDRLEKLKAEFLRSVQLEALVAVRKYLSDTSIRDLLNARE